MRYKKLKPIEDDPEEYKAAAKIILKALRDLIYKPLLDELDEPLPKIKNSLSALNEAISSGRITYVKDRFYGRFSSNISRTLKGMGAKWDGRSSTWAIELPQLPADTVQVISLSRATFQAMVQRLQEKIAQVTGDAVAKAVDLTKAFDTALFKTEKSFEKSIRGITVAPTLSKGIRQKIAEGYNQNLKTYIASFAQEETEKLRSAIMQSAMEGMRYETLIDGIQQSYGVSERKAAFLARQETNLMLVEYKKARYTEIGLEKYEWRCVIGSPAHPVRPMHKRHDGKIFRWDSPPVVDEDGRRAHPGQDFNCVVEGTLIGNNDGFKKLFKRPYEGEVVALDFGGSRRLTVTPNHPILTARGWLFAKDVQDTDKVFEVFGPNTLKGVGAEVNNRNATAEAIFNFAAIRLPVMRESGMSEQFHGDGIPNKEIEYITIERELPAGGKSGSIQNLSNFTLTVANKEASLGHDQGRFMDLLSCFDTASDGIMSVPHLSDSLGRTHALPLKLFGIGLGTNLYLALKQMAANNIARNGKPFGDAVFTHLLDNIKARNLFDAQIYFVPSAEMFGSFVQVRSVHKEMFSGNVFNFETDSGTFAANGILTHNCRCIAVPVVEVKPKT